MSKIFQQIGAGNRMIRARLPQSPFWSLWLHRDLIWQLAEREVIGRYRGSIMGVLWSFFYPVLMLAVYTFVFSSVFKVRWVGGMNESKSEFAINLFAGIIVYTLFSECANRAPGLILNNANFVKKVVFPLEILPWVSVAAALFHTAVSTLVLLLFFLAVHFYIHWTALLLPLVLIPLVILTMGICWFLASIGVYVRDVGQTVGVLITLLMFLSPVFYPVTAIPLSAREYIFMNPLTFIIEQSRAVLVFGKIPDWEGLGIYCLIGLIVASLGLAFFQKTRKGFADVL